MAKLILEGYVVRTYEISSGILTHPTVKGRFRERILPSTFKEALNRSEYINLLWNHDKYRPIASTKDGTLTLWEDQHGLAIKCEIDNQEAIKNQKKIKGFSLGFYCKGNYWRYCEDGLLLRNIYALDITEVSLMFDKTPAYSIPLQITKQIIKK